MKTSRSVADRTPRVPDKQLAVRAAGGDQSSFAQLVTRHHPRVYNFVLRRIGNAHDAEDVTQESFTRAWAQMERYDERYEFTTWLYTIAGRIAINHLRSRQRDSSLQRRLTDAMPTPTDTPDSSAEGTMLWRLAATVLTNEQHAALWLRYAENLSPAEIARIHRRSTVSVRVMLFRARQRLLEAACTEGLLDTSEIHADGPSPPSTPALTAGGTA